MVMKHILSLSLLLALSAQAEWSVKPAANPKAPALILVTHHVEEITPSFTHALLLREGSVTASGPVGKVLTSAKLSETFGHPVRLRRRKGSYLLEEG